MTTEILIQEVKELLTALLTARPMNEVYDHIKRVQAAVDGISLGWGTFGYAVSRSYYVRHPMWSENRPLRYLEDVQMLVDVFGNHGISGVPPRDQTGWVACDQTGMAYPEGRSMNG